MNQWLGKFRSQGGTESLSQFSPQSSVTGVVTLPLTNSVLSNRGLTKTFKTLQLSPLLILYHAVTGSMESLLPDVTWMTPEQVGQLYLTIYMTPVTIDLVQTCSNHICGPNTKSITREHILAVLQEIHKQQGMCSQCRFTATTFFTVSVLALL